MNQTMIDDAHRPDEQDRGGVAAPLLPLCVDLDGTLVRADLLHEALLRHLGTRPGSLLSVLSWAARGPAVLKAELAARVELRPETLPFRTDILAHIAAHRRGGGKAYLVTASPRAWAEAIADHVGLFDGVSASDAVVNLKARNKADHLVARFGRKGFDYIGDSRHDRPVWRAADGAMGAGAGSARYLDRGVTIFTDAQRPVTALLKVLRPHQWVKNALVLVALVAAHRSDDPTAVIAALLAFVAFSCCASSAYVLNDLLDIDVDRQHPRKRDRPFASGALPVASGLLLVPLLVTLAVLPCLLLPPSFGVILACYLVLTNAYSITLKRRAPADVFALAVLYTIRIVAGAAAIGVPLSLWLLAFSMFLFLSLAMLKRHSELLDMADRGKDCAAGRGYWAGDTPVLVSMGTASGYCAVLVLSLYVGQAHVAAMYRTPVLLWLICPLLLFWISRFWLLAQRREMHDDPVVMAARDPISRYIIGTSALIALAAAELEIAVPLASS